MKINKNIIKELNDYLDEFNLTEIEYSEKDLKVKVSKSRISQNIEPSLSIEKNTLAVEALNIMNINKITGLCVHYKKNSKKTIGFFHIHNILEANIQ